MAVTRFANVIKVPSADVSASLILPWSGNNKQPVSIRAIRWVGGTTINDTAVCKDVDGNVIFESIMVAVNLGVDIESVAPIQCHGLAVTACTHGTVYVYLATE